MVLLYEGASYAANNALLIHDALHYNILWLWSLHEVTWHAVAVKTVCSQTIGVCSIAEEVYNIDLSQ